MINRVKAKIFTQKITGSILGAPVQNIGGFDRIIFCDALPIDPLQNVLYINKTDGTGNWYTTQWNQFALTELDPVFLAWLQSNPTSGTNTGDQFGDGVTITGSGTFDDPFVAVGGTIDLSAYLKSDTTLQNADTPEDDSLFSFWKIGIGRVKIPWANLIATISTVLSTIFVKQLSNGCHSIPTITNNNNGTVTIGTFNASVCAESGGDAIYKRYVIASSTLTLVDLLNNYIVVNYNSGTPILAVTQDVTIINETTIIPVFTIFRNANYLHTQNWDSLGNALANKVHQSIVKTQRYRREYGLMLSEFGTRNLALTPGRVWTGAVPISLDAINTTTDSIYEWYKTGGVWTQRLVTAYNNTEWQDVNNLATLTANRYAVRWIFRGVESEKHLYCVYGTGDYTENQAQNATVPALPIAISSHAVLVAKLIVQKSGATALSIESAFDAQFSYSPVRNHQDLTNLKWNDSRHTGTANTVAGFDSLGVAKEYALTDFGGGKRLVQQNSWSFSAAADSFNGWCYNPSNHVMFISPDRTYIFAIDAALKLGARTQLATANSWIGIYIPLIDKYHIFTKLSTSIIVVNGTTLALEAPITIDAQTSLNRSSICFNGDYEYFTSGASGAVLNQRNLTSGVILQTTINSMSGFKCFTQGGVNYIAVVTTGTVQIYNELLATVSTSLSLGGVYTQPMKIDYLNGKLGITGYNYTVNNPPTNKTAFIDTTNISAITLINEFAIAGRGIKLFADYFVLETSPQNLTANQTYDFNIAIYDYDGEIIDNRLFFGYNNYCVQSIQYDSASDTILAPTANQTATWNSAMYLLKIK